MVDVSVIIPVYNAAKTLERCIESLLCQEGDFSYEIILVNDGSIDTSVEQLDKLAVEHNRVIVFHQPNAGPGAARNTGIAKSRGRYVVFVDADDYVNADYIRHLYDARDERERELIIGGFVKHNAYSEKSVLFTRCKVRLKEQVTFLDDCKLYYFGLPFSKLYNLEIIRTHSITFKENIKFSEDLIFCLSYLQWIDSVHFINHADYYYECGNPESLIHSNHSFEIEYAGYVNLHEALSVYMDKFGVKSEQIPQMCNWVKLFVLRTIKSTYRNNSTPLPDTKTRLSRLCGLWSDKDIHSYMERDFTPNFLDKRITKLFKYNHLRFLDLFLNLFFRLRGLKMVDTYLKKIVK